MNSTQYNGSSRTTKNLFRERSISSLPSRQMSVMNVIHERQSAMLGENKRRQEERSIIHSRQNEISKLRRNLQTAVSTAINERLQNSKTKEEIVSYAHHRHFLQNQIKKLQRQIKKERQKYSACEQNRKQLAQANQIYTKRCGQLQQQLRAKLQQIQSKNSLYSEIEKYKVMVKDLQHLKARIITLQDQVRQQKLKKQEAEQKLKQRQKQRQELINQIAKAKPKEQELKERIAYFQRVNLDLERKMQDYNRRQNDYIKQVTNLKVNLTKMTADRNHFKTVFEQTTDRLSNKIKDFDQLTIQYNGKLQIIQRISQQLQVQRDVTTSLKTDLQGKVAYYQKQGEENEFLKQKNRLLQAVELELRRVVEGYVRVSQQVNMTIVSRCEQIKKLKTVVESYKVQLGETEQKFQKFDKCMQDGSQKSYNQIRQGFYALMRRNNQFSTQIKQMRVAFDEKFMILGEERDMLVRSKQIRSVPPPSDDTQFIAVFHQKTEALILLQNSNDQLLKIKKDLENKIEELYGEIEKERKEMITLKLKTAELFRVKKDMQQARKKMERYQEMIQEQNQAAADMQSQMNMLRGRNSELNEKIFITELEKRNLDVRLAELNEVIKELDVSVLENSKKINEKNAHLIGDSLQKLQSAIKSLAFFFNCAFCGELPLTPVTLALCGHNYCQKCKEAFAESCYECDTGQPIEKVFQNRFLKDAGGKYKFLTMVVGQLKSNFVLKGTNQ